MYFQKIDTKWQKMPPRNTRRWYVLMHEIRKNLKYACASLRITNPNLDNLHQTTKDLVRSMWSNKSDHAYYEYGLGVALRELQPFILPWVKIAKHKIAKEFRVFLLAEMRKAGDRKGGVHSVLHRIPKLQFYDNDVNGNILQRRLYYYAPSLGHLKTHTYQKSSVKIFDMHQGKLKHKNGTVRLNLTRFHTRTENLPQSYYTACQEIALGKTPEGRAVLLRVTAYRGPTIEGYPLSYELLMDQNTARNTIFGSPWNETKRLKEYYAPPYRS